MTKQVVAFPLYRQLPVDWFFQWLKLQKTNLVATVATEGIYLPRAMESLVNMAETHAPDYAQLIVYEHDMIPPVDGLDRMAQYGDEHDIVGTVYFKHDWPHHVMAWHQVKAPYFSPLTAERTRELVEAPGLYEVDAVAMGFTAIARRVFDNWDYDAFPMWDAQPPLVGHDLWFCHAAKQQGFKVWLDSGIGCGHLTLMPIGYSDSQAALAEAHPPQWTEDGVPCGVK